MPKISQPISHFEDAMREIENFKRGFRRSRKGNLYREYEGVVVTIFGREGSYGWVINSGDESRFSSGRFGTEEEAMDSVCTKLDF